MHAVASAPLAGPEFDQGVGVLERHFDGRQTAAREGEILGEAADFIIGSGVTCSDGHCGELKRVVIDPVARAIAHVVVAPNIGGPLVWSRFA